MKTFTIWKLGYKTIRNLLIQPFTENELFCPPPFLWQSEFEEVCANQKISLVASTGAGKSRAIKVSSYKWNKESRYNKSIIVVPQTAIGSEFGSEMLTLSNGETVLWTVSENLCRDDSEKTIQSMVDFIKSCPENPDLRTIVCCHQTLCGAYDRVKDSGEYKNIKLIVDEAHHVSTGEDEQGNFNPNKIGEIFLHTLDDVSNSVLLVTATHFRTDETTIIPTDHQSGFIHFEVPFYRVQDECRFYNKQIQFNYAVYKTDVHEGLTNCFDENLKTIIFVHPKIAMEGKIKKHRVVKNAVKSLGEIVSEDKSTGTYSVKTSSGKTLIVADLVSETFQDNAKEYIRKVSKDEKSFKVDVIIAMRMFMEGSDYPPLQHCIIHGIRDSYGNIIQMAGRVTRDFKNKSFCRVTMLLPHDLNIAEDNAKDILNNHLKFIVSSMSLANFFKPVYLRIKNDKKRNNDRENGPKVNPLSVVGDDIAQNRLRVEAIKSFTSKADGNDDAKKSFEVRLELMKAAVKENIIDDDITDEQIEDIAEKILTECALSIVSRNSQVDIEDIEYDFLKTVDTTEFLFSFCSDLLSSGDIKEYKKTILRLIGERKSLEEHIKIIKENGITGGGIWVKYYEKNNLAELGFYINPWLSFGMTCKQLFILVWGERFKSKEDHIKFITDNNITGRGKWEKIYEDKNLKIDNYFYEPWESFKYKTSADFFGEIWGHIKTEKEHIDLIKEHNITSKTIWKKYYKENDLKRLRYRSCPWYAFGDGSADFFGKIFHKPNRKSIDEHAALIKLEKITGSDGWFKYYDREKLNLLGYVKCPWLVEDVSEKRFFESIRDKRNYRTRIEYEEIIKENNITGYTSWKNFYDKNNLSDVGYSREPWGIFKVSLKEFFSNIIGEKIYKTREEHDKVIIDNKITGMKSWNEFYIKNNLKSLGYYVAPWESFKCGYKKFFEDIYGKKIYKTKEEHLNFIRLNKSITGSHVYKKYYDMHNMEKDGYYSSPWQVFKMTETEFFSENKLTRLSFSDHISIMKEKNINGAKAWATYFKKNELRSKGYFSEPWNSFKYSIKDFFNLVK